MIGFNRNNCYHCPCKGCVERVAEPNCHGACERYKEWRAKIDDINKAERVRHQSNDTMSEAKKRHVWRSKRYSRQLTYQNRINTK